MLLTDRANKMCVHELIYLICAHMFHLWSGLWLNDQSCL